MSQFLLIEAELEDSPNQRCGIVFALPLSYEVSTKLLSFIEQAEAFLLPDQPSEFIPAQIRASLPVGTWLESDSRDLTEVERRLARTGQLVVEDLPQDLIDITLEMDDLELAIYEGDERLWIQFCGHVYGREYRACATVSGLQATLHYAVAAGGNRLSTSTRGSAEPKPVLLTPRSPFEEVSHGS
jgi:hypothetical protein